MSGGERPIADSWRSLQARLARQYVETKNAFHVGQRLDEEYAKLDPAAQKEVDREVARWLSSGDSGVRWDALWLIESQGIASALPELQDLAARLASETSAPARFEQKRVAEVIGPLSPGQGMSRDELVELVREIMAVESETQQEHDELLHRFVQNVPHPESTDLIYYPDRHFDHEPTPEEVVDLAVSYKPIGLGPAD